MKGLCSYRRVSVPKVEETIKKALLCQLSYAPTKFNLSQQLDHDSSPAQHTITSELVSDAEFGFPGNVRDHDVERVLGRVIRSLERRRVVGELRVGLRRRPVVNHDLQRLPPGRIGSLACAEVDAHRVSVGLAGESLAKKLAVLVAESVAVIEIQRAAALLAGIDPKLQRAIGSFIGALDQRLQRKNASAADVHRQGIKRGMNERPEWVRRSRSVFGDVVGNLHNGWFWRRNRRLEAGPEVIPITLRERDHVIVERLGEWLRSDQQAGTQQKLRIEIAEPVRRRRENFRELEKNGTHHGEAGARGFVGETCKCKAAGGSGFRCSGGESLRAPGRGPRLPASASLSWCGRGRGD